MSRKIFFFFFLLVPVALRGQYQGYNSPDFWKRYTEALTFDLKLEPLSIKKTDFHFRFWNPGQVIDIRRDSSAFIQGEITCYAKEYDEMNLGKRTFYSSKLPIEKENASEIYQLILGRGLSSIPTGDAISGWGKDAIGFTYIIEYVDSSVYSFKCYLSPIKQTSLKEAITIQSFIYELEKVLKLKKKYKSFAASVPFWCYTKGTPEVICKKK
jgi:hypothetical protein